MHAGPTGHPTEWSAMQANVIGRPPRLTPPEVRRASIRDPWLDRDPRILIADDMSANLRLLRMILMRAGYRDIRMIERGDEVVPSFLEYRPDIALLDLHMPG